MQPHLSQSGALQWVILSFALCFLDYLLTITLAVENCPCVHTANLPSIRLPCVSLPQEGRMGWGLGGGLSVLGVKATRQRLLYGKTALPPCFPSFLEAVVHLAPLLMLDPAPPFTPLCPPLPHHCSFLQGAFPLRGKFLVTTLLISPVVNVLPWESGQEVSQTWRWVFWGIALPLLAPASSAFPLPHP